MKKIFDEIIEKVGKKVVKTLSDRIVKNFFKKIENVALKITLFISLILVSIIFITEGIIKLLSKIKWLNSGLGFILFGIIIFISSIVVLKTKFNK